jgi:hypothetical protein
MGSLHSGQNHTLGPNEWNIGGELHFEAGSRMTLGAMTAIHDILYHIDGANAPAPSATGVLAAKALTTAAQAITTGITDPAVPRNATITGNAAGIAGNVTVKGTNNQGVATSEVIALNGTATVAGAKAFATITEVDLPIQTHGGTDTVSVGFGAVLGLPTTLPRNTVRDAFLNNVKESTPPTVVVSATVFESNTVTLSSTLNGSGVDIYFLTA